MSQQQQQERAETDHNSNPKINRIEHVFNSNSRCLMKSNFYFVFNFK